jgi:site-specific DNA recombinase
MTGAIGYARVSTDEQARENNSLAVQKRKISSHCEANNLSLLKTFEESESARTMDRPGLQELLSYCRTNRRKISHVVVSDLSRLARNVQDQAQIIVTLKKLDITMVSIDEPLTDDSAMGQFVRNMLGSVNQLFSDTLSERTRYRMQAAVKAGRFLWPAPVGYLNKSKRLYPDAERAPLVREAFQLVASGRYVTTDAVLKLVTALGLRTRKGRPLSKQSFSRMLSNPIYCGWVVSGETQARGSHEPLISAELFQTVQTRITSKGGVSHKKLSSDFPLRGVVQCAKCKKPLTAGWAKGRKERYARYWCWTKGCGGVGISRDDLEGHFLSLLSSMEPTAELLRQLPTKIAIRWKERKEQIATEARRLTTILADQQTLNQKAVTARVNGVISSEDFDMLKKNIAAETFRIENEISSLDSERSTMEGMLKQAESQAVDLVGAWENGDVNQRQELAKSFFPEGLVFSHERKFFEPANTVIAEMMWRWVESYPNVGVPDGI